jgi:hypothetical protein
VLAWVHGILFLILALLVVSYTSGLNHSVMQVSPAPDASPSPVVT